MLCLRASFGRNQVTMALIVQKYGGTSVGTVERIQAVAERVARFRERGDQVVVVDIRDIGWGVFGEVRVHVYGVRVLGFRWPSIAYFSLKE